MLKRLGFIVSSGLLKVTLFSLALAGAGWMTFNSPENIKQAANDSNLYDSAVTNVLDSAKQEAEGQNSQLPLDDPRIEAAAKNAFPPELLSQNSESIIDGVYGWLEGKTDQPQFSVDLQDAKQNFSNEVADYAQTRYEALPPCTFEQLRGLSAEVEPFEVDCKVPGLTGTAIRDKVFSSILGSEEFLKDTTFTFDDLPKDEQGRSVTQNLAAAPDIFKLLGTLPWILGILAVIFAIGGLFFAENKRRGLKSIAITLLSTGIFLFISSLLVSWSFKQVNSTSQNPFEASLVGALITLVDKYNDALLKFIVIYVVIGAGILLSLWYQNRTNKTIHETDTPSLL